MIAEDPRRRIPRTDALIEAVADIDAANHAVKAAISTAQNEARALKITPEEVEGRVRQLLGNKSLKPVLNATGVVVHTNIGRAPLSTAAQEALINASGYADVEMDLERGVRSKSRGAGAIKALLNAVPAAEDALVVNNGAAALLLATTALAENQEVIISRGELIEIGAGFRLPELIESARVELKEIGATNRTHPADYERAINTRTGAILKVHPSNFRISGFTSSVGVEQLREIADQHSVSLIVDLGSGLLHPDPVLPEEPSISEQLEAGADVVIASGDKLLGGPQAGLLLGKAETIARLKKHPLARAVRVDKLTLAALEATVAGPQTPVEKALHLDPQVLKQRTQALQAAVGVGEVVLHDGRVGGGGAPGYPLEGWALRLPEEWAKPLRTGEPVVLGRVHENGLLIDLRCIPESEDETIAQALRKVK